MTFTTDQLQIVAAWYDERQAKSIGSFPSEFGVITDNDELNRAWRIEISDELDMGIAFMRQYHSVKVIPDDFNPESLPESAGTVSDPMMDGETYEGIYRHVRLRTFRQEERGTEYFYVVQTIAKHFEVAAADFSQFRLATSDYYHANHSQPILRLENVDPAAAHSICESLNQDIYTDIEYYDGILEGTWYRIRVRAEVQNDGSYNVFLLLADSANTNLYFKYQATPSTIRGFYYKWEATDATVNELFETVRFMPDGSIDEEPYDASSKTLQEVVPGRTVTPRRGFRDENDRLFDLEIEIAWSSGSSSLPEGDYFLQYGEPLEAIRFVGHFAGADFPDEQDLLGRYVAVIWNATTKEWDTVPRDDYDSENMAHLTGRRLIRTFTKNERVVDETIYFDLYEMIISAPMDIQEQNKLYDMWFYEGGSSVPNRRMITAYNGFCDSWGDSFPPGDWTGGINSNHISRFFCEYNVKTTDRNVKMFVRRPTKEDLLKAGAIAGIVGNFTATSTSDSAVNVVRNRELYVAVWMYSQTSLWGADLANAPKYENVTGNDWVDGND